MLMQQSLETHVDFAEHPICGLPTAPAYTGTGFGDLLVTAGDDGYIRIWRLDDIIAAAAAAASGTNPSSSQPALTAAAVVQLPHVQNQLGISAGSQPAAQVLGVDLQQQRLFAAGSDGGVHVIDIARLSEAAAQQQSSLVSGAAAVTSLQGHAAGVLGLDYSAATQQLASASEVGLVRHQLVDMMLARSLVGSSLPVGSMTVCSMT